MALTMVAVLCVCVCVCVQYYEIVIFSQNPLAEEVVAKLDPKVWAPVSLVSY